LNNKRREDFSGGNFMKNISRGPGFGALFVAFLYAAFTFAFALSMQSSPASAVQTYYYQGQPFDPSECPSGFTCVNGPVTAVVTLAVPAGYTGHVTQATSYFLNVGGVDDID
jgi:hypothetical protein